MFAQSNYTIGSYQVVSIKNQHGIGFDFIPQKGGAIHQVYLGEQAIPLLDPFLEGEDISVDPRFKQALLFPFPGRVPAGKYSFNGRYFNFPINEKERNNALHGFLYREDLDMGNIELLEEKAIIDLAYNYEGQYAYYPFPCKIKITYTITASALELVFTIENTGELSLPYGFGWHPYFKFADKVKLSMPVVYHQILDSRMLPTGEENFVDRFLKHNEIVESLDDSFRFVDEGASVIKLGGENNIQLQIMMDDTMGYIQLYKPEYNCIAVEPLTCGINAFNTGKGLITLMPGEKQVHTCQISLLNNSSEVS